MMEAARTSETSVDNHFTRQYNPEDSSEQVIQCLYNESDEDIGTESVGSNGDSINNVVNNGDISVNVLVGSDNGSNSDTGNNNDSDTDNNNRDKGACVGYKLA
jgi:hypothetical protein